MQNSGFSARPLPALSAGTKILLGVTGSIAAYKACELTRRLIDLGCSVRVVVTENAQNFVSATTFHALSGEIVRSSLWDNHAEAAMGHIELARWADCLLIAPASANTIAKLAHGLCDDLLGTLALATTAPLVIAPAMNQQMFASKIVQSNLTLLQSLGALILGPANGAQACGDVGPGRMLEALEIINLLQAQATDEAIDLSGLRGKVVVITAGPTYEDLDPVRYLGNRSSGKMGFAIAQAAAAAGADVSLIAGPCVLATPAGVARIDVRDARSMHAQALSAAPAADLFIAAAAVADYRPAQQSLQKIKKTGDETQITLVKNPDIIADVSKAVSGKAKRPLLVGFAAETETVLENARAKRIRKGLDFIAANHVGPGLGMEAEGNALVLIGAKLELELGYANKSLLARRLLQALIPHLLIS